MRIGEKIQMKFHCKALIRLNLIKLKELLKNHLAAKDGKTIINTNTLNHMRKITTAASTIKFKNGHNGLNTLLPSEPQQFAQSSIDNL